MSSFASSQYGLAIHTTTPQLGIALSNFAGDRRTRVWDLGRNLSSSLHKYLQEILIPQTWQDIGFIAVAKGPGGFTGTRIGVVTARTLGQQLNIPVYGISTLAAFARETIKNSNINSLVAVQMKTRREQLFVAIYRVSSAGIWSEYLADSTMTESEWQAVLTKIEQPWQLIETPEAIADSVNSLLTLAYAQWKHQIKSEWSAIIPFYGQNPV